MKSLWDKLWSRTNYKWLLGIPVGGLLALVIGAIALGAFNASLTATNSNEFCVACHIGMDTVVEEYRESIHFKNVYGIVATCADCHVPQEFVAKMKTKISSGVKDIYKKYWVKDINLGNFESEHRLRLARHVWQVMDKQKSSTCQSCHNPERWDLAAQPSRARLNHDPKLWAERGVSCADCHTGVAHKKPVIK